MEIRQQYIINPSTFAIEPRYDKYGKLIARVTEGKKIFLVDLSPLKIIENSCHYYSTSLNGAIEGSRAILGNFRMVPITICSALGLYWFPTKSIKDDKCVWLAQAHVMELVAVNRNKTRVVLRLGHSIELNFNKRLMDNKRQRAGQLRLINNEHIRNYMILLYERDKGVQLVQEQGYFHILE